MSTNSSAAHSAPQFPSTLDLFRDGYQIFKQEWKVFLRLGLAYIGALIFFIVVVGTLFSVAAPALSSLGVLGALIFVLIGLVGLIFFYWLLSCVMLTILYVIQKNGKPLDVTDLFMKARHHVWSFIWVNILTLLVVLGLVVLLAMASFIVFGPLAIMLPAALTFVSQVAVFFMLVAAALLADTWFGFTTWTFVDKDARGLQAIAFSRHLSHHHFVDIAWRLFWIALVYVAIDLVVKHVLGALFFVLPGRLDQVLTGIISDCVVILLLVPILGSALFSLYKSAEKAVGDADTDSADYGEHRGILIVLATIGLLTMLASVSIFIASARFIL